jgi:hypothetical protein
MHHTAQTSIDIGMRTAFDKESWKPVVGYEGLYEVSDMGRVRSLPREVPTNRGATRISPGRVLALANGHTYLMVSLSKAGSVVQRPVHRLVAMAFHGNPFNCKFVRHLNGQPHDNRAANLLFGTPTENEADKRLHGTYLWGELVGTAKLKNSDVLEIRRLHVDGHGLSALASRFCVSKDAIWRAATGRTFKHPINRRTVSPVALPPVQGVLL